MERRDFLKVGAALVGTTALGSSNAAPLTDPLMTQISSLNSTITPQSSDRWEIAFKPRRVFRILQVTDTHFSSTDERDQHTVQTIGALIRATNPDLIVHTGDFVNNDSKKPVSWSGVDYFNRLKRPWALCFGNHDYPVAGAEGCLSLEDYHKSLRNCAMGFVDIQGKRHYCYRHDLKSRNEKPAFTLYYFQVGYAKGDRKISDPQLVWFNQQLLADKERDWDHPILVFVHIPLLQFDTMAANGFAIGGFKNEDVHFDSDTGETFKAFAASKRVKGVFCGHDHINSYFGEWEDIGLYYGRVSGWGGYGAWPRGGRLISLNLATGKFVHREVLV